jgi:membrane protein involved in colicin uptake
MALTLVNAAPASTQAEQLPAGQHPSHSPSAALIGMAEKVREVAASARIKAAAAADDADTSAMAKLKRRQAVERARVAKIKAHRAALAKAAKARAVAAAAARQRAARAAARKALLTPSYVWAHRSFSIAVANCESGGGPGDNSSSYDGNAYLRDPNGHYGKWQFDYSTWRDVGGSGNPASASIAEQDARAYRLYLQRGWQPWQCARMVG